MVEKQGGRKEKQTTSKTAKSEKLKISQNNRQKTEKKRENNE